MAETKQKYSVCMSVYKNDNATYFADAVMSIYDQTCPPDEIILVIDGPVPEKMHNMIDTLVNKTGIMKLILLEQNMGHAIARQTGLEAAKNNLCAVMDADDLSVPDRFEKQLKAFVEHPDVTVVGGLINEFINEKSNVVGTRWVPENDDAIKIYLKDRCPMNLVTVMMRKDHVLQVGGYIDWYCEEDYYLWIRLALAGYKFYNIQQSLVNVRVGLEMYSRRGGIHYFKSESALQKFMFQKKIIGPVKYFINVAKRLIVQVLLPNNVRGWVFRKFARK